MTAREHNRRVKQVVRDLERDGYFVSAVHLNGGTVRIETGNGKPPPPACLALYGSYEPRRPRRQPVNRNTDARRSYRQQWFKQRASADPFFVLNRRMAKAMRKALGADKAGRSWEDLAGYTLADLRAHLESRFVDGMSWENIGAWHIDHIRPLASFKPHEFNVAWAMTNLQPLWGVDNLRKGAKW